MFVCLFLGFFFISHCFDWTWKSHAGKAGFEPRSAVLEADSLPAGHRGGPCTPRSSFFHRSLYTPFFILPPVPVHQTLHSSTGPCTPRSSFFHRSLYTPFFILPPVPVHPVLHSFTGPCTPRSSFFLLYRLVGQAVGRPLGCGSSGFDSRFRPGQFSSLCHTSDLKMGSPVATLRGDWCYRINSGTGGSCVSIL